MSKRLKLSDLKVTSFVTELKKQEEEQAKGGIFPTIAMTWCGGPAICVDTYPWRYCKVIVDSDPECATGIAVVPVGN